MEGDLRRKAESRAMALQHKVDEDIEVVRSLWVELSDAVSRRLSAENISVKLEKEAAYAQRALQVDLLLVMSMGNGEGLGDPGVKSTLLKLAHPSRDTCGTSRTWAGLHRLHHLQGIKDHPDRSLQMIVLIALSLKGPSYMAKLLF